jgi:tRNA G18 (ribose-2'-O)-methylase SpoU
MKKKIRTTPDWSCDSEIHIEAQNAGYDHFYSWNLERNVIDEFKSLSNEEIKAKLYETSFPYVVLMENWMHDLNVGTCIRNANAFNARKVYYVGDKRFDKRGCQGVQNYSDIEFLSTMDEFNDLRKEYHVVGLDNINGAKPLDSFTWQAEKPIMMVFGSEGVGLTPQMQQSCDELVYIRQFGSVRSLNAATASGIIMNDFVTKYGMRNEST